MGCAPHRLKRGWQIELSSTARCRAPRKQQEEIEDMQDIVRVGDGAMWPSEAVLARRSAP
jgi:hypothetical protein